MIAVPDSALVGDRVSYEDMANPRLVGTVVGIVVSRWGTEFQVEFDDGSKTTSDLRQYGWRVESVS